IGYKDVVVFPLHIVPQNATKPVLLRLKADYAVCEKICIPVEGRAELLLDGRRPELDSRLAAFEALVPKRAKLGAGPPLPPRPVGLAGAPPGGHRPGATVEAGPRGSGPGALFAEGPPPDWALPVPEPAGGAPAGLQRFAFVLDGLPPGASADGALLTFTLVS